MISGTLKVFIKPASLLTKTTLFAKVKSITSKNCHTKAVTYAKENFTKTDAINVVVKSLKLSITT